MISASLVKELRDLSGAGMMDCKKALEATNGNMDEAVAYLREKGIAKAVKKESRIAAEGLANILIEGNKALILEVNSETDFVSKNEEFTSMINEIGKAILNSDAKTIEEALALPYENETINDLIVAKTAKIGEKLSLRRFEIVVKNDDECFGEYLHMGGKIASLTVLKGASESVAKDVAMQAAAMKPQFVFESDVPQSVIEQESAILKEKAINEGKSVDIASKMVEGGIKKFYKENCLAEQEFIKDSKMNVTQYVTNNGGELIRAIRFEVGEGMEKRNEDFASEVMAQVKGN